MAGLSGYGFGGELHPRNGTGLVLHPHDLAVLGPGGDIELGGQGFATDRQAVVARAGEAVRQSLEHALAVVMDPAGLAMHQALSADHLAAIGLPNRLVAEADAE